MELAVAIILSLAFSALFSGMEIAYVSSNKLKIELDKNKGKLAGRIMSDFVRKPSSMIGALLIGNNIALVIYGLAMATLLEPVILDMLPEHLERYSLILLIQTLISTLLILFVAEFLPKTLFRINPNAILNFFAVPLRVIYWILYPFVFVTRTVAEMILKKLFRVRFTKEEYVFSAVDLQEYVKEFVPDKKEQEEIQQELQIFQNAIDFRSVKLREILIPRPEISAVEVGDPIGDLIQLFIQTKHSKILVYKENIDHIIGYVHSSDLFRDPKTVQSIIRSVPIVPETMLANNVLKRFIQEHKNIAVVVDEFGGTSGIVTMEDIIEEIFGEIEDEYDEEELVEKKTGADSFVFSARLEIDYINEKYGLNLPESEDYETLGGLIIHVHESIPGRKDVITMDPYVFTVREASENRIDLVEVRIIGDG